MYMLKWQAHYLTGIRNLSILWRKKTLSCFPSDVLKLLCFKDMKGSSPRQNLDS